MSLHSARSLTKILPAVVMRNRCSSSPRLYTPKRCIASELRQSEEDDDPVLPPRTAARLKRPAEKKSQVIDKGDRYKAGEDYYSFHSYSFYDQKMNINSRRQPQPSSGEKMKVFCMDKLNPPEVTEPRRLLPEDYGYLVEWPHKPKPKTKYRPMYAVMKKEYNLDRDPKTDPMCRARIPL